MKILVINGPNLNRLGTREPEIYGSETLEQLNIRIETAARARGVKVEFFQSNHEGALIDRLHAHGDARGIIINPGALAHYSIALRDGIASIPIPTIEVHISNIFARERFRHHSVISGVCRGVVTGLGTDGYLRALEHLIHILG